MPRTLSSLMVTALSKDLRVRFLFECEFLSSTLRLFSSKLDLSWGSKTWLGNGFLYNISNLTSSTDLKVNNLTVQLVAASSLVSTLLTDVKHGGIGSIYLVLLDESNQIIPDPFVLYSGELQKAISNTSGEKSLLSIDFSSSLSRSRVKNEQRINNQFQLNKYSEDIGFQFVQGLANKSIFWGLPGEGVP